LSGNLLSRAILENLYHFFAVFAFARKNTEPLLSDVQDEENDRSNPTPHSFEPYAAHCVLIGSGKEYRNMFCPIRLGRDGLLFLQVLYASEQLHSGAS